ncbi:MAG: C-terminal helicase domain-containing protein, partial [Leifsonia sp.]
NQEQRERAMAAFKAGKKDILIATDVAARGIDVNDVTHVINHTVPDDHDTYLHRAGRTGRAGKTGIAVTFVDWDDLHKWALINRALEMEQPDPVETYSSSPHLYEDLDIPAGSKGRLKPTPVKDTAPRAAAESRGGRSASGRGGSSESAARSGSGTGEGSSGSRNRRRTRGGQGSSGSAEAVAVSSDAAPADAAGAETNVAAGTHDGQGHEHHDGNSAPRRRRRRGPRPTSAPQ